MEATWREKAYGVILNPERAKSMDFLDWAKLEYKNRRCESKRYLRGILNILRDGTFHETEYRQDIFIRNFKKKYDHLKYDEIICVMVLIRLLF